LFRPPPPPPPPRPPLSSSSLFLLLLTPLSSHSYDIGVTGGVTSMPPFLSTFFPGVYAKQLAIESAAVPTSPYCKYDSPTLQLFTSSLFMAGLIASLAASYLTSRFGRKVTMLASGIAFLVGAGLTAGAVHVVMLVVGRIALGVGVGFANQAVPLYLSEMAPYHLRGACNIMFQLATTIGILVAQLLNMATSGLGAWGWRVSLAGAALPAVLLTLGGLILPDTPNSLAQRGHEDAAVRVLRRLRGVEDVDAEMEDIRVAVASAAKETGGWTTIFQAKYRPELTMAIAIPLFQQFTGINSIMFYAPVIMSSLGMGTKAALLNTVIIGAVNVGATLVSVYLVDRAGRKPLFIEGGIQMAAAQIAMAALLGTYFKDGVTTLPPAVGIAVIAVICLFVSAFAWSWGPLGWLVPTEIQPLETRSVGQGITVAVNFALTFIMGQFFVSMMCGMRYGIFLFFAAWVVVMTTFVAALLPETKGVPLEEVSGLWRAHWFWKRVVGAAPHGAVASIAAREDSASGALTGKGEVAAGGGGDDRKI
jgi:MFS transporter, SP family, sugar:H+ symporter